MRAALSILCVLVTLGLCGSVTAYAQQDVIAKAAARRMITVGDVLLPVSPEQIRSGHGWGVVGVGSGSRLSDLLQFPPFDASKQVTSGSVRNVMPLSRPVLAAAGWDGSVYFVFSDGAGAGGGGAGIGRLTANRWLRAGAWEYVPTGRVVTVGSLPEGVTLRSLEQSKYGLVALWETRPAGGGAVYELAILDDLGWRTIELPSWLSVEPGTTDAHLLPDATRVVLAIRPVGEGELRVWGATVERGVEQPPRPTGAKHQPDPVVTLKADWDRAPVATLALPEWCVGRALRTIGESAPDWLLRVDGQYVLARREKETLNVWRLTNGRAIPLASVEKLQVDTGVMGASGAGRLRVVTAEPRLAESEAGGTGVSTGLLQPPAEQRTPLEPGSVRVVDISLSTGEVLFDGGAHTDGLISKREFQVLWMVFLGIGAVMLLFVMRAEPAQQVVLPAGSALATPGRRTLAALLDAGIGIAIAAVIFRQSPGQFLAPGAGAGPAGLAPVLVSLLAACVHCALGEGFFGRSPGKALLGLTVVAMRRQDDGPDKGKWVPARVTFGQAVIRNVIRWWMPPLGVVMYFDANWRHPGDQLARTVVVTPLEAEDEPGGGGNDQGPE